MRWFLGFEEFGEGISGVRDDAAHDQESREGRREDADESVEVVSFVTADWRLNEILRLLIVAMS